MVRRGSANPSNTLTKRRLELDGQLSWTNQRVHRWYFITEGLPVGLVRQQLRHGKGPVLDPFLGTGTVIVEAKLAGIDATGIDSNPFMCFASYVKTRDYDPEKIAKFSEWIQQTNGTTPADCEGPELERLQLYYTRRTFQTLLTLRSTILDIQDSSLRKLFLLCFVGLAVRASKMKKTPALRFRVAQARSYPVLQEFRKKTEIVVGDLTSLSKSSRPYASPEVLQGDSRDLSFLKGKYGLIVTSPPYCNNVDFVRHCQLELLWLGCVANGEDLGRLRHAAITSCEAMAHEGKDEGKLTPTVQRIAERIERRSERRYHKVVKQYFVGMGANIESVHQLLRSGGRAVYVIGDSWFHNVHVPTHKILASLARKTGFRKTKVRWLRWRYAGRPHRHDLSEYILELRK